MNPTPTETSSCPLPFRTFLFALIGGERGCPRKRFFISLLLALFLLEVALWLYTPCYVSCISDIHRNSALGWVDALLGLLAAMAMFLAGLAACPLTQMNIPAALLPHIPVAELASEYSWLYALGLYLSAPVLLASGLAVFAQACRRLRDAGCSRWNLLAGLTPWAFVAAHYAFGLDIAEHIGRWPGFLLCTIGGFWLFYLYCRPTRRKSPSASNPPSSRSTLMKNSPPEAEQELPPLQAGRVLCACFLVILLATALFRVDMPAEFLSLPLGHFLFFGGFPAILLMLPSVSEHPRAELWHGLAIAALFGFFLPIVFCVWDEEELASDANAAIVLVPFSILAHVAWFILSLPWFICRVHGLRDQARRNASTSLPKHHEEQPSRRHSSR